ncbi:MAG TPA: hypothetical protein VMU30_03695 [Bacteroidota bacterium]|nr:hypothetical protein [Bacteroidota bacterium]
MNPKIKILFFSLLVSYIILMLCSSCKDQGNNNFQSNIVFPDTGHISFTIYVQPLFQQTCVAAQCHGGSNPVDGLDLTAPCWDAIHDYKAGVLVGSNSLLYKRIAGIGYTRMPPQNYPALTTNQINGVKRWLDQGAGY